MDLNAPVGYVPQPSCSCGSEKAAFDYVPDTVYGLSIQPACCIHDYMYSMGKTHWDKERSDRIFLENMLKLVELGTKWGWLKWLRKHRVYAYYKAVVKFGGPSFWEGKEKRDAAAKQEVA